MTDLYLYNRISKQGHLNALQYEKELEERIPIYLNIILEAREIHPVIGLEKIYKTYQPEGIGRDAFVKLGKDAGFMLQQHVSKIRTTISVKNSRYRNLLYDKRFTDINQLWTSDITYFDVKGKTYYLIFILDVYSRRIVGYKASDNMRAENNLIALEMALVLRGIKKFLYTLIHHSDKGGQYVSNDYTDLLTAYEISISMCNEVYENSHIERVNGIIKNDYLIHWEIENYQDLCKQLDRAVYTYNNLRTHSSIGDLTPVQFEALLPSIPTNERIVTEIFTSINTIAKQNGSNPNQLMLQFGS
jgi:putative transposase